MTEIIIEKEKTENGWMFLVTVKEDGSQTKHAVLATEHDLEKISGKSDADPVDLVKKSFEFLLERESKESILGQFNLPLINKYFPEYIEEIRKRL